MYRSGFGLQIQCVPSYYGSRKLLRSIIQGCFMKFACQVAVLLILAVVCKAQQIYTLENLQGAWWSDNNNPTADFAILDDEVWLDSDAEYHPCKITDGDILEFDLGPDNGSVKHKILSLDATTLVLEHLVTHATTAYTKSE